MNRLLNLLANAFPLWVTGGALVALWHPPAFLWFLPFIIPGLARLNFSDPLTTVPCAISATFHSVIGSILAGIWRLQDAGKEKS
jgi:predicted Na+-dependent transporter